jgi:hypothetical protein
MKLLLYRRPTTTGKLRYQFLSVEWLKINEDVTYRRIMICNSITKLRGLGKFL